MALVHHYFAPMLGSMESRRTRHLLARPPEAGKRLGVVVRVAWRSIPALQLDAVPEWHFRIIERRAKNRDEGIQSARRRHLLPPYP